MTGVAAIVRMRSSEGERRRELPKAAARMRMPKKLTVMRRADQGIWWRRVRRGRWVAAAGVVGGVAGVVLVAAKASGEPRLARTALTSSAVGSFSPVRAEFFEDVEFKVAHDAGAASGRCGCAEKCVDEVEIGVDGFAGFEGQACSPKGSGAGDRG